MNSPHYHAVIWIDHREARVFHFSPTDVDGLIVRPEHPTRHIHHKANCIGSGHAAADRDYLQAVVKSVEHAGEILITGPANAKLELIKYIHQRAPDRMNCVAGVETVDRPSDGELVAYARKYLKAADRMRPR